MLCARQHCEVVAKIMAPKEPFPSSRGAGPPSLRKASSAAATVPTAPPVPAMKKAQSIAGTVPTGPPQLLKRASSVEVPSAPLKTPGLLKKASTIYEDHDAIVQEMDKPGHENGLT